MSSTRRSRYTVTASHESSNEIVKRVVLCYSADDARYYYAKRGYAVLHVERGDYRRKQAAQAARSRGGFHIDQAALAKAKAHFGLKLPVEIKLNGRVGNTLGIYRLSPKGSGVIVKGGRIYGLDSADRLVHEITLKSYLTPEKAGESLYHELTHAMQAERELARLPEGLTVAEKFRKRTALHAAKNKYIRYEDKPCEREARKSEALNATMPLAR